MPTAQPTGVALAVAAMAIIQLGIALSEPLLHELGPAGVVTLRLFAAAALLWPLTRPALRGRARADLWSAIALGVCAAVQTLAFFAAIDRIPLGRRGGDRVPRSPVRRPRGLAAPARRAVGGGGRRGRRAAHARTGCRRARSPGSCAGGRLGGRLGRLHRAHQARRRALERTRGPRRRARRGRRADARPGRRDGRHGADRPRRPRRRRWPRAARATRAVRARDARPAAAAGSRVRHRHEPRAGDRRRAGVRAARAAARARGDGGDRSDPGGERRGDAQLVSRHTTSTE